MSSAKRTLRQSPSRPGGRGRPRTAPPAALRHVRRGELAPARPAIRGIDGIEVDAHLPDGRRADLTLPGRRGTGPPGRAARRAAAASPTGPRAVAGAPLVVLDGRALAAEPLRWRPLREQRAAALALPLRPGARRCRSTTPSRCACSAARSTPRDGHARASGARRRSSTTARAARSSSASATSNPERRRVSLYCAFDATSRPRVGPIRRPSPRGQRRRERSFRRRRRSRRRSGRVAPKRRSTVTAPRSRPRHDAGQKEEEIRCSTSTCCGSARRRGSRRGAPARNAGPRHRRPERAVSDVPRGPALTLAPEATVAAAIEAHAAAARARRGGGAPAATASAWSPTATSWPTPAPRSTSSRRSRSRR